MKEDLHIAKVEGSIRKYYIDGILQLVSILLGNMGLIGQNYRYHAN